MRIPYRRPLVIAFVVSLLVCAATPAKADSIVILNTGTGPEGSIDPYYHLVFSAHTAGCTTAIPCGAYTTVTDGFPITPGFWLANSATSKWIQPDSATSDFLAPGNYFYRTTFDLTGLDHTTASLSGQWGVDNLGVDIFLNGLPQTATTSLFSFNQLTPFSIDNGFTPGINTLDFWVVNFAGQGPNPSGLRVEVSGDALPIQPLPVPEPASASLMVIGFAYAAARRWTRRPRG